VPRGFPISRSGIRIGQSRSMYLSWTDDGPLTYSPYTCAGDMPGSPGREAACAAASEVPGRLRKIRCEESGNVHLQHARYWTEEQVTVIWLPTGPRQLDRCARRLRAGGPAVYLAWPMGQASTRMRRHGPERTTARQA
jgi:hypothetical protein